MNLRQHVSMFECWDVQRMTLWQVCTEVRCPCRSWSIDAGAPQAEVIVSGRCANDGVDG